MTLTTLAPRGPADWNVPTAAVMLGLSENSIRRAIAAGKLAHRRIGPAAKLIRIDPATGYAWRGLTPPAAA
jgi:hypothetical protein